MTEKKHKIHQVTKDKRENRSTKMRIRQNRTKRFKGGVRMGPSIKYINGIRTEIDIDKMDKITKQNLKKRPKKIEQLENNLSLILDKKATLVEPRRNIKEDMQYIIDNETDNKIDFNVYARYIPEEKSKALKQYFMSVEKKIEENRSSLINLQKEIQTLKSPFMDNLNSMDTLYGFTVE